MSISEEDKNELIADNIKLVLDGRQESAVRRFSTCDKWGILLLHKVGTGKTITSLLIALNTFRKLKRTSPGNPEEPYKIMCIAPVGIYNGFLRDLKQNILFNNTSVAENDAEVFSFFDIKFLVIDYNYDKLIYDINRKECRSFKDTIIIMDEAHRLLTNDINNPTEAGGAMKKHSLIEDLFFRTQVAQAIKVITMSGTPMQQSPADLCRFGNFLTQTNTFTTEKYARKQANLVWATFIIKNIGYVHSFTSTLATVGKSLVLPTVSAAVAASGGGSGPILYTTMAIASLALLCDYAMVTRFKNYTNKLLRESDIREIGKTQGGKKNNKSKTKKAKKTIITQQQQHGGAAGPFFELAAVASMLNDIGIADYIKTKMPDMELMKKYLRDQAAPFTDMLTAENVKNIVADAGPGIVGNIASSVIFQGFTIESVDALNTILEPVYDMRLLATDLSPYMSIYDYELQDTLNLACLDDINRKLNEILPGRPMQIDYYNINGKKDGQPLYAFTEEENLKALTEINKIKQSVIADIASVQSFTDKRTPFEKNYPKCNMPTDPSQVEIDKNTEDTRFPEQIVTEIKINFSEFQMNFIMDFCLGIINDDDKEILNLNKYEKISIDFKEKLDYFVKNLKFVSCFTPDVKDYYAYLDSKPENMDFKNNKYKYARRAKAVTSDKPETKVGIFECDKFLSALALIEQVNTGELLVNNKHTLKVKHEEKIKDDRGQVKFELDSFFIHPAHGGSRYLFDDQTKNIRSKDEEATGKYLPVVYSYIEDFGLASERSTLNSTTNTKSWKCDTFETEQHGDRDVTTRLTTPTTQHDLGQCEVKSSRSRWVLMRNLHKKNIFSKFFGLASK